jgi:hypothetical protein
MTDLFAPLRSSFDPQSHARRLRAWIAERFGAKGEDEAIRRSRETLSQYDDRLFEDIGIAREQAMKLTRRPHWGAPDWWIR